MKLATRVLMVVAMLASAWTFLAAQSGPVAQLGPAPAPAPAKSPFTSAAPAAAPGAPASAVMALPASPGPLTPLQQRYLQLSAKKAHLMNEEQLQQAVGQLDREVDGLNAWSKIEESARLLREVIDKHPQTKAAETARSALSIIEQHRPAMVPVPDPLLPEKHFDREQHFEPDKPTSAPLKEPPPDSPRKTPLEPAPPNV